ncbi:hypothetical protein BJX70DRAFT_396075 [Aspergillus crustosus]
MAHNIGEISEEGIAELKHLQKFKPKPYNDSGNLAIGYGINRKSHPDIFEKREGTYPITLFDADQDIRQILPGFGFKSGLWLQLQLQLWSQSTFNRPLKERERRQGLSCVPPQSDEARPPLPPDPFRNTRGRDEDNPQRIRHAINLFGAAQNVYACFEGGQYLDCVWNLGMLRGSMALLYGTGGLVTPTAMATPGSESIRFGISFAGIFPVAGSR